MSWRKGLASKFKKLKSKISSDRIKGGLRWTDLEQPEINETGFRVSRPRPRLASIQSQFRDRDRDFFLVVSTTRLRPRLFSQSLNFEIEIETFFVKSQDRD